MQTTAKQERRYRELQERVRKTYYAAQHNSDPAKQQALNERWVSANRSLDLFIEMHF